MIACVPTSLSFSLPLRFYAMKAPCTLFAISFVFRFRFFSLRLSFRPFYTAYHSKSCADQNINRNNTPSTVMLSLLPSVFFLFVFIDMQFLPRRNQLLCTTCTWVDEQFKQNRNGKSLSCGKSTLDWAVANGMTHQPYSMIECFSIFDD